MKQTAVEWLAEVTAKIGYISTDILEQAKQMEKKQIINAYTNGSPEFFDMAEEYYNETYKNETNSKN